MAKSKSVELEISETAEIISEPVPENMVAGEKYDIVNTQASKEELEKDGWIQQTKEPFVDVDGKSKLIFQKKSFYKFLEVES